MSLEVWGGGNEIPVGHKGDSTKVPKNTSFRAEGIGTLGFAFPACICETLELPPWVAFTSYPKT
jgi:hypothetical protein